MFDHRNHSAWADFRAWLLHREDMDRKARGLPPLEIEIAAALKAAMPDVERKIIPMTSN